MSQRAGPHGVTEGRHGALQVTALHGPAKDVEAVLADEPLRAPGSVADEVHPALDLRQREARKLQPHLREERDDPGLVRQERLVGQAEEDEVIDVPAVELRLQHPLDEVVHRVQEDQRVELREQVPDGDADRLAVVGEQHHQVDEAPVLDLPFDQAAQDGPVDPVEELPDVELQRVAAARGGPERLLGVVRGLVGAVTDSAGERLADEGPLEDGSDNGVDRVLDDEVTEGRREDRPPLRLEDQEREVRKRLVRPAVKLVVERVEVARQVRLELKARARSVLVPGGPLVGRHQRLRRECLLEEEPDPLHTA